MTTPAFHIAAAFDLARKREPELERQWIQASHLLGGRLPKSSLVSNVQRLGRLDLLLRALEAEAIAPKAPDDIFFHEHLCSLSSIWIELAYEISRLAKERLELDAKGPLLSIEANLRILRMPLFKLELALKAKEKKETYQFSPFGGPVPTTEIETYRHDDSSRTYTPITLLSTESGSIGWTVFDATDKSSKKLFRRDLADQFLAAVNVC